MSDFYTQGMGGYPYGAPNPPQNQQPKKKPVRAIISMVLGINGAVCAIIGVIYLLLVRLMQFAMNLGGSHLLNYYSLRTTLLMYYVCVIFLGIHALIVGAISIVQGNTFLRNYNTPSNKFVMAGRITSIIGMAVGLIIILIASTVLARLIIAG